MMVLSSEHVSVLAREVVDAFDFDRPAFVVDGTLGLGGHSEKLLEAYPDMKILGLDWDADAVATTRDRLAGFGDRFEAVEASYADLSELLSTRGRVGVDGILLDLGLSSRQLSDTSRGFSFLKPGPLDMRMSRSLTRTAWDLLRDLSSDELARLFQTYGEEPHARRIATALKAALTKGSLANDAWQISNVIRQSSPSHGHRIDPATRCFQALRIAVNGELKQLDRLLGQLPSLLLPGGRAVIISFHSLEDRRVKQTFQAAAKGCICPSRSPICVCGRSPWARLMPRKAIQASDEEIARNPRSRSARLRILEKI